MRKNILITWMPKSGKSTLIKKVLQWLANKVGFFTNEIRENFKRVGFELENHKGSKSILSHIDIVSDLKVSKYFVDIEKLDNLIPSISEFKNKDILFIDEIGEMELFSDKFRKLVLEYLNSENICIASISKIYSDEFIELLKKRDDTFLIEMNENNRLMTKLKVKFLLYTISILRAKYFQIFYSILLSLLTISITWYFIYIHRLASLEKVSPDSWRNLLVTRIMSIIVFWLSYINFLEWKKYTKKIED